MSHPIDSVFGIHAQALGVWQQRAQVLAANLANADTPDYKAQDVDFRAALASAGSPGSELPLAASAPGDIAGSGDGAAPGGNVKWRTPMQPSMDGNTVDPQVEQAAYAGNTVHFQASLTFINAQISMLRTAITGDQ